MAGARLWVVNGVLVVLALVAVLAIVLGLTANASSNAATLRTVPVGRGTVTETVTASGTVTSATSSTLDFSTSGKIATVRVRLGDRVTAGETVATLDGQYARANLTAARAQLTSARKQLSNAIDARDNPSTTTSSTGSGSTTTSSTGSGSTGAGSTGAGSTGTGSAASGSGTAGTGSGASPSSTGSPNSTGSQSSTSSRNSAQAGVDSARASVDQAQASVIQAEQGTDNLDLVSPQDGTVVSLDAVAGQVVGGQGVVTSSTGNGNPSGGALPNGSSASSGATSGGSASSGASGASGSSGSSGSASSGSSVTGGAGAAAVMTVADLDSLQVKANIPELDVGRVATGLPTTISVNALPGQTENGSVASVDVLPGSGTSVQYGTAIGFTAPPPGLRPGMSASVSIAVASASDTPFLPSVAVTPVGGAGSTTATVRVLGPDRQAQQRTIGIGLTSDATTQVTSGLAPGDLVVLPDPTGTDATLRRGGGSGQNSGQQSSGSSSSSGR